MRQTLLVLLLAVVFALVGLAAGFFLSAAADSAPVPVRARKDARPRLGGVYRYRWQGGGGEAAVHPGGGWKSRWCGQEWIGSWRLEGDVLIVCEAVVAADRNAASAPPNWYEWRVQLEPGKWSGRLPSGGSFELLLPAVKALP